LLSNYAGQKWLDGFNGTFYFPAVVTIDTLLAAWFFFLATHAATENATSGVTV
jgi:hypothetical protein